MITQEQLDALTPSSMLKHMLDGIISHKGLENFNFDLGSYGHKEETGLCVGCCATVAIASISNMSWTEAVGANYNRLGWSEIVPPSLYKQVCDMEMVFDNARCGYISSLFWFCNLPTDSSFNEKFCINRESDIEEAIPKIQEVIDSLEAAGF